MLQERARKYNVEAGSSQAEQLELEIYKHLIEFEERRIAAAVSILY